MVTSKDLHHAQCPWQCPGLVNRRLHQSYQHVLRENTACLPRVIILSCSLTKQVHFSSVSHMRKAGKGSCMWPWTWAACSGCPCVSRGWSRWPSEVPANLTQLVKGLMAQLGSSERALRCLLSLQSLQTQTSRKLRNLPKSQTFHPLLSPSKAYASSDHSIVAGRHGAPFLPQEGTVITLSTACPAARPTQAETKMGAYLKIIRFIVVHVQGPVQLTVSGYRQLLRARDPVVDGLPRVLLHLNVVKLTEIAKPLDELRGNASVELLNLNSKKGKSTDIPSPQPHYFQKAHPPPLPLHLLNSGACVSSAGRGGGGGRQIMQVYWVRGKCVRPKNS